MQAQQSEQIDCSELEHHCCCRRGSVQASPGARAVPRGRNWRDGKMEHGRAVINTDRRGSVLVREHNNRRGLAQPRLLCGWQRAERHWESLGWKSDCDSCFKTEEKLYVWRVRMWCFECECERNSSATVWMCVCNLRSGDRIWALPHPVCVLPKNRLPVCLEKEECADWRTAY